MAVAGPAVRVHWVYGWGRAVVVVALGVAAVAWASLRSDADWVTRAAPAVVGAAVVLPLAGVQTAAWFAGGSVLASWVLVGIPPLGVPRRWRVVPPEAVGGVALLAVLAAWRGRVAFGWSNSMGFLLVAAVALTVAARWGRAIRRVGHLAGLAVSSALFGLIGLVAVAVPWAAFRVTRVNPLGGGAGWGPARTIAVQPSQRWSAVDRPTSRRVGRSRAPFVAAAIVVLVAAVVWTAAGEPTARRGYSLTDPRGVEIDNGPLPAAYADAPWYREYLRRNEYAAVWLGAYRTVGTQKVVDGTTGFQTVRDGVRVSWTPPECECRRLTVWMYGASTTFGVGQRDDHTIPSELAKRAWKDGIALDVVNRGVPGDQHWQEANRFAWDMSLLDDPPPGAQRRQPDLVVFYDGVSDINGAAWLGSHGLGDVDLPVDPMVEEFLAAPEIIAANQRNMRGDAAQPPPPAGIEIAPTTTVPPMSPAEVGRLATRRYAASMGMSRATATATGTAVRWFWQPSRFSRPPVDGEPTTDDDDRSRAITDAAERSIPAGVIDLTDVFARDRTPLFSDDVHHNERGARLVAEGMYRELRSTLDELLGGER